MPVGVGATVLLGRTLRNSTWTMLRDEFPGGDLAVALLENSAEEPTGNPAIGIQPIRVNSTRESRQASVSRDKGIESGALPARGARPFNLVGQIAKLSDRPDTFNIWALEQRTSSFVEDTAEKTSQISGESPDVIPCGIHILSWPHTLLETPFEGLTELWQEDG